MKWEEKLSDKLRNRQKRDRTTENFLKIQHEIIRPTFEKIKKILYEYNINSFLDLNDSSLSIEAVDRDFLLMKIDFQLTGNDELFVEITYFDLNSKGKNKVKETDESVVLLSQITEDYIGDLFVTSFEKTTFFDN